MKNNNLLFALVIVSVLLSLISIAMVSWNYKTQLKIAEFQKNSQHNQTEIRFYNDSFSFFVDSFVNYHNCINDGVQNLSFCLENQLPNCTFVFSEKRISCELMFNKQINSLKIKE